MKGQNKKLWKCLEISKISSNFATPLEEMCHCDSANLLRVRSVAVCSVYMMHCVSTPGKIDKSKDKYQ